MLGGGDMRARLRYVPLVPAEPVSTPGHVRARKLTSSAPRGDVSFRIDGAATLSMYSLMQAPRVVPSFLDHLLRQAPGKRALASFAETPHSAIMV
jgi:hypothetical protein